MTPKEKAEQLVETFRMNVLDYEGCSINDHKAKQCANIAVKEILRVAFYADDWLYNHFLEVKQEIEKL